MLQKAQSLNQADDVYSWETEKFLEISEPEGLEQKDLLSHKVERCEDDHSD